jgi:hypothetical protein
VTDVSSTHAFRGMLSRRLEISMGDWLGWFGATSSLGLGLRMLCTLRGFVRLSHLYLLMACCDYGADFAILSFFLVVVTSFRVGLSVTGIGVGLREGGVAALTTRPTRATWFHSGPRLFCSAGGSAHIAFGAVGGLGAPPPLLCSTGTRLASAPLTSFHFTQARYLALVSSTASALMPLL